MTEVTRVPLKPISRQSLLMLVLGILIGLAIAGVAAWLSMPPSVSVSTITAGEGDNPKPDDVVFVSYVGKLEDGKEFDRSQNPPWPIPGIMPQGMPMPLANMLPGFRDGLLKMQKGGKYTLFIPAADAYGATPPPGSPIPPNADLTFEIELFDFMPLAAAERRFNVLQQRVQQRQAEQGGPAAPGAPGTSPAPAPMPAPAPAPAP
ncbi:MAG: hypothetical protein B7Z08_12935 [Sphingomonadales bacterium 32-68-7]|nr:MAG: hypothetical protein B7Z33_07005 [Sphingomonadales bacterium 12-68-11]OYX07117.1 MAG: hypothetical protein B7Z08_12935 [Sphingomonadales bacterium 32-68-7]